MSDFQLLRLRNFLKITASLGLILAWTAVGLHAQSPTITSLNPTAAPWGSNGFQLSVNGTNFGVGSTVYWNGVARATTRLNSTSLQATIPTSDLAGVGSASITVSSTGLSNAAAFAVYTALPLPTKDLVYDRLRRRIVASIPGTGAGGNSIASIDPSTIELSAPVFVGSEPGKLAISDNGQYLYVGLDGAAAVRRVDMTTQTPDLQFSLGTLPFFGPNYVYDMEVAPGTPSTVAVSYKYQNGSAAGAVSVFDSGIKRPVELPRLTAGPNIEFSASPLTLYGYGSTGFQRLALDASGITIANTTNLSVFGDIKFDGGRVYFAAGTVINPDTGAVLGTFNAPDMAGVAVVPDSQMDRVFFLTVNGSTVYIHAFNRTTFAFIGSITIPNAVSSNSSLSAFLRWGDDGLAFRSSNNQVFLVRIPKNWFTTGPTLTVSSTTMVFPTMPLGGASPVQAVTVTNNTNVPVPINVAINSISATPDFYPTDGCSPVVDASASCVIGLTFYPAAAGFRSGVLDIQDSSSSGPHLVGLFGIGNTSSPVPFITSLSPNTAAAGSNGFLLTVTGANFVSGAVVRWNGVDQPTTFVNSSQLTIIVSTNSLAGPESSLVTVFNPAPDGGISNASVFSVYRSLSLSTRDLVYDKSRGRIYASIPGSVPDGNSIASINPFAATVGNPIFIGSEPGKLAISDNDQYLYAALDGAAAVRRMDLASQTPGLQFPLGMGSTSGPYYADGIAVQPGNPGVVAVSRRSGIDSGYGTVGIYDDGIARQTATQVFTAVNSLAFSSSPSTLYGSDTGSTSGAFQTMSVDPNGVTAGSREALQIGGDIKFDGGQIYGAAGRTVDAGTGTLSGAFTIPDVATSVVSDSAMNRVFFLTLNSSGVVIRAYNRTNFTLIGILTISGFTGVNASGLVRWGDDGLAFRTLNDQVILVRIPTGWFNPAPTLSLTPTSIVFPAQAVGTTSTSRTITFKNNTPSAVSITSITTTAEFSQTNTCGATIPSLANCTISVTFTPSGQGNRTGLLTIVDGGSGSPRIVGLSGFGGTSVVVPSITYLSPEGATVGSVGLTLTVVGKNFFSGSVVRWNGIDRTTTFVNNTQLTATIPASSLIGFENAAVTVFNPSPNSTLSNSAMFSMYRLFSMATRDLIYDRFSRRIYASIPGTAPGGNSIVAIDPPTAIVGAPVWVGSEPNKLALSDNGQYLYIGLDGAAAIRRFDLASQTPGIQFSVGNNLQDLKVMPGNPTVVAVSRSSGVAAFDDGVKRTVEVPPSAGLNSLVFSDTGTLYGVGSGSILPFNTMSVTGSGVTLTNTTQYVFSGTEVKYDSGQLVNNAGWVLDPVARQLLGKFILPGYTLPFATLAIDSAMDRVFLLSRNSNSIGTIYAYERSTFRLVGSLTIPGMAGNTFSSLVRWGDDGLAFRSDGDQVILVRMPKSWFTTGPALTVSPLSLAFPTQPVGTTSTAQGITLTNNTGNAITISNVAAAGDFSQTNSCSSLAAFATCSITVAFSPTVPGNRLGTVAFLDDTSPVPHVVGLSGVGNASFPVPLLASLNPAGAPVGSAGFTMNVFGSNFVSGSVVRWNGIARPTTFVNSFSLTVSITASDLATFEAAKISVFNPAPDGGVSNTLVFSVFKAIPLATNNLIYHANSGRILAATSNTATPPSSIVPIDPVTATLGSAIPVGFQPDRMALSDDLHYLYTTERFGGAVRRIDMASQTPGLQFSLGFGSGEYGAYDLQVLPGNSAAVAVARNYTHSTGNGGVGIYDDGVKRPGELFNVGATSIAFGNSPSALYGIDNDTNATFRTISVNSGGATLTNSVPQLAGGQIKFDSNRIYVSGGAVIDPASLAYQGKFSLGGAGATVIPDSSTGRVFFLTGGVQVFDKTNFTFVGSLSVPGIFFGTADLVRWGSDGLAFHTSTMVYLLRIPDVWIAPPIKGRRSQITSQ